MSKSQKYIKIVSILSIIGGIITIILGTVGAAGLGVATQNPQLATELSSVEGYTPEMGTTAIGALIGLAFTGLLNIIAGIFGLRAAKDANKVGPLYIWSLISMVFSIIGFVATAAKGSADLSAVINVIFPIILFICANNVKKQKNLSR